MLYFHKELKEKFKSDFQIQKLVKNGELFKLDNGLYSDVKNVSYIEVIEKKYPKYVIYGESAFYFHNLTDYVPKKITLATTQNDKIRGELVKQAKLTDKLFGLGITKIKINNVMVNIYDKERMLLELVRSKNTMGYDMYKEIISNYRRIVGDIDIEKLEKYLSYFSHGDKLFEMIQDEVF